jgi:hypothetical protein
MTTHTLQQRTNSAGTLTLTVPLGQPDTEFEIVLVAQPRASRNNAVVDHWAEINAFRERLATAGILHADSVDLIREDRDP